MRLPEMFVKEMKHILGQEYELFEKAMREKSKKGLRIHRGKISVEEFLKKSPFFLESIPYVENGFYYQEEDTPGRHPYYNAGLYYIQEPSAMVPASLLSPLPGDKVLDLCAAPGGKATEWGSQLKGEGVLFANDISSSRAKALLKNLEMAGIKNLFVTAETPERLAASYPSYFDKILIDAPCSGEGMFRKENQLIKSWEKKGPKDYKDLQKEILSYGVSMLKPKGKLLYSTCTFSPEENEGVIDFLLKTNPDMELLPINKKQGFSCGRPDLIKGGGEELKRCIRLYPHSIKGEGHFMALLQKKGREMKKKESSPFHNIQRFPKMDGFFSSLSWKIDPSRIFEKEGYLYYLPDKEVPKKSIRYLRTGLLLGEERKNTFVPSQALAMALKPEECQKVLSFNPEDRRVIKYLKGETIDISDKGLPLEDKGYYLICVEHYPLGFGKKLGHQLKNKYELGWRWT